MARQKILASSTQKNKSLKDNNPEFDHSFRMLIVGDGGVGKTCLVHRFTKDTYTDGYISSIAAPSYSSKDIKTYGKKVKTLIYDIPPRDIKNRIEHGVGVHAYMFVFDVTDRTSFDNIKAWMDEINLSQNPIILVANKVDLVQKRTVSSDEASKFVDELKRDKNYNITYAETSAKTGENVDEAFTNLTDMCVEKYTQFESHSASEELQLQQENRDKLIMQLDGYIKRIEAYNNSRNKIDFSHGFWFYANSRACNREANYHLAIKLQSELKEKKPLEDIFDDLNISNLRGQEISKHNIQYKPYFKNRGINSKELNNILKEASKMIDSKQASFKKGP